MEGAFYIFIGETKHTRKRELFYLGRQEKEVLEDSCELAINAKDSYKFSILISLEVGSFLTIPTTYHVRASLISR